MNNAFLGSLVVRFAKDFNSWLRHSLANRLTRDPKSVIHGNSCIILYITNTLGWRWRIHSRNILGIYSRLTTVEDHNDSNKYEIFETIFRRDGTSKLQTPNFLISLSYMNDPSRNLQRLFVGAFISSPVIYPKSSSVPNGENKQQYNHFRNKVQSSYWLK